MADNELDSITPHSGGAKPKSGSPDLLHSFLRFGLLAVLGLACLQIVMPFASIVLWALILAVTLQPTNQWLSRQPGLGPRSAPLFIVLLGLLLLGGPVALLASSFVEFGRDFLGSYRLGDTVITAPPASVANWPVIGEPLFAAWTQAADSVADLVRQYEEFFKTALRQVAGAIGSTFATLIILLLSLALAGIFLAYSEAGELQMRRISRALAGSDQGIELLELATATIRSVVVGVIGVAFIQALLLGLGFLFAGIPAAGILALIVLVLGVLQLPILIITVPVLFWLWGVNDHATWVNAVLTLWIGLASISDSILKPLLLGRGLIVPMPVILIGALGGFVSMGFVGLFLGAVILAVGFQLFMAWVDRESQAAKS